MRYHVLATDYDGTLAHDGKVDAPTLEALEKLLASGRRLVMVTGRELPDLFKTFPRTDLFELIVAENGGVLYRPSTREEKPLADAPPAKFVETLKARGVASISVGRVIVATWEPYEKIVLDTIRDLGLELQVIFNKGAVMILPAGVNKATGLTAALKEMHLSAHNVVGIGDAENDHAFMHLCECSVAVSNALISVKDTSDWVTSADHGTGVTELIGKLLEDDFAEVDCRLQRHHLPIGTTDGGEQALPVYGSCILVAGPSASGKSTVATLLLEALEKRRYQYCVIDPEGDYENCESAVVLGGPKGAPASEEVLSLLQNPDQNAVVSLTGMPIAERPGFFLKLLPQLLEMRAHTGRPHWLILDEAHHLMPAEWQPPAGLLPDFWHNVLLITVHPELLAKPLLERVGGVIAVGAQADQTLKSFATLSMIRFPEFHHPELPRGDVLYWQCEGNKPPVVVHMYRSQTEHQRHRRKYAEGELPPDRSFYFQGQEGKMNIRVQNLMMFLQVGLGIDDETWSFHLERGDYAEWFREKIKDEKLAVEAERIAGLSNLKANDTRQLIRQAIENDYTLSGSKVMPVKGAG